ncbi:MAG: ATP-binding cassette domain-containing protein [Bacteroidales bacterium]
MGFKTRCTHQKNAQAEITSVGLTGLKAIEIRGGSNEAENLKPGSYIQAGSSITREITGKAETIAQKAEKVLNNLQMGVFYQNGGLLNSLTVGENIALPLEQHTDLNDELITRVVWTKLQLVNLLNAYYLYPSQLSGGMLKRAALARAIVMDPLLLFCDEPGAGLDPISLASLDDLILNLREQMGMSIVIITHEVSSILRIADRIIFISRGKKIFQGTLKDALESDIEQVYTFFEKGRSIPENPT